MEAATKLANRPENLLRAFGQIERKEKTEGRKVKFVASTEARDRHGTVIRLDAWRLDNFNANPICAYMHETSGDWWSGRPADPDFIIGPGRAWIEGKNLMIEIDFEDEENDKNPLAEKLYRKVLKGTLRAVSVGFRVINGHWGVIENGEDSGTYYFDEVELLEVSLVNIPSNPEALKRSYDSFLETKKTQVETTSEPDEDEEDKDAIIRELEADQARLDYLKLIAK